MAKCDNKNPLQRSGTSSKERLLLPLQPSYVKADEKDFQDWIVFGSEFSFYLKYYNINGGVAGDWTPFFTNDISAILGSIAIQDIETYRRSVKERFDFIKLDDNKNKLNLLKSKLQELFATLFTLSEALDKYHKRLDDSILLKSTINRSITSKLKTQLRKLIGYYKYASDNGLLIHGKYSDWKILYQPVKPPGDTIKAGLSDLWYSPAPAWPNLVALIEPDQSIYGDSADPYTSINHAINHNLFSSIFDQYLAAYSSIVSEARKGLLETLQNWNSHPPHYALFLSFLKLFTYAREQLNTYTGRHLDFYYKDILRLIPKAASPNKVHVIVELAKQVDSYLLKQGTLLKAGKDSDGKEVLYQLIKDEVFNKAKVSSLKAVYFGASADKHTITNEDGSTTIVNNEGRLFASPVINSDDGFGKELTAINKEWHPFVNRQYTDGKLTEIISPNGIIGFAVASHYLFLAEGERKVELRLACGPNNKLLKKLSSTASVYITAEKQWISVSLINIDEGQLNDKTPAAIISFTLGGEVPAITGYSAEVHEGNFDTTLPVLKILLNNYDDEGYIYTDLSGITISKVELKVSAGKINGYAQNGVKQLLVSNDLGTLDPSKPFQPFGPQPRKGSALVIGNAEVFSKKDAAVNLQIEWTDLPDDKSKINYGKSGADYPSVSVKFLAGGVWEKHTVEKLDSVQVFNGIAPQVSVFNSPVKLHELSFYEYGEPYSPFNSASTYGFFKIILNDDFGMKKYQDDLTTYLVKKAKNPDDSNNKQPDLPYTPVIQSIHLSYEATTQIDLLSKSEDDFENRGLRYFHIYPFGVAEQHNVINKNPAINLLPHFSHTYKDAEVALKGEFYIGLSNALPQSAVNILFQVLEGSEDPMIVKPEEHVFWSYLSNDEWIEFKSQEISDGTRQLVQSGIISFVIPYEASLENKILPPGFIWLKAGIQKASGAIAKLISVDAQAAVAEYKPSPDNAENFLDNALPAGQVSKLKLPESGIKKIDQPFASFGGRPKEQNEAFYVRVSERLRHKARAITIWDYEHLVLEAFPAIYKVKCLNHTKIDDGEYNEVLPGYVSIITIPNLINRNDTNPLKPYTSQALLSEIEEYLLKKVPCYVSVKARNPQFEEVRLSFKLKIFEGLDFTFYSNTLKDEVTRFLTPWAFAGQADIEFGGTIHKSVLINFIEERSYVDFITEVQMFHIIEGLESSDLDMIHASTARSILVSAPATAHVIFEIKNETKTSLIECIDPAYPVKKGKS